MTTIAPLRYGKSISSTEGPGLMALIGAIAANDSGTVTRRLQSSPALAQARLDHGATRQEAREYYVVEVGHYLYVGDTALHVAAAGYRRPMVVDLVSGGADVAAANRRGAQPLHYAADGKPGSPIWGPGRSGRPSSA